MNKQIQHNQKAPIANRVGAVERNSGLHKFAQWMLWHPKQFIVGLAGLFCILAAIAIFLAYNAIPKTPSPVFTHLEGRLSPTWELIGQTQVSEHELCRHYKRSNGVQMTSCYEYDGSKWVWTTGY